MRIAANPWLRQVTGREADEQARQDPSGKTMAVLNSDIVDLLRAPEIGPFLGDTHPAWVWEASGRRVLWANTAGLRFLKVGSLTDLTGRDFDKGGVATHIARVTEMGSARPTMVQLRFFRGLKASNTPIQCRAVDVGGNKTVVAGRALSPAIGLPKDKAARLKQDCDALTTVSTPIAVLDRKGVVHAAAEAFPDLSGITDQLPSLLERLEENAPAGQAVQHDTVPLALSPLGGTELLIVTPATEPDTGTSEVEEIDEPDSEEDGLDASAAVNMAEVANIPVGSEESDVVETSLDDEGADATAAVPDERIENTTDDTETETASAADETVEPNDGEDDFTADELTGNPETAAENSILEEPDTPADEDAADVEDNETVDDADELADASAPSTPEENSEEQAAFVFEKRNRPDRFVWQMDSEGRFTFVSYEFAQALGPNAARLADRTWHDVAQEYGLNDEGAVEKAIEKRDTWSGVSVLWPAEGTGLRVPVDLAALPAFGRNRTFEGFRGFGICRTMDAVDDPNTTGLTLGAEPTDVEVASDTDSVALEPETSGNGDDQPIKDAAVSSGDGAETAPARGEVLNQPTALREEPAPIVSKPLLSKPEREAFRQIADALGARLEGDDHPDSVHMAADAPAQPDANAPSGADAENVVPLPSAFASGKPSRVDATLLDRLPIGVIIARDRSVLYANQPMLGLIGYPSKHALDAAGGLEAVIAGPDDGNADIATDKFVKLRHCEGHLISVVARLHAVPWNDGNALMMSFRAIESTEPAPPVKTEATTPAPWPEDLAAAKHRIGELEAILDTATDGVLMLDGSGAILSANGSAEALFDAERKEMVGQLLGRYLAPESRRAAADYLDGLSKNGVASVLNDGREVIGVVAQGGLIPLFMTIGRIGEGETAKYCAVLRDITQWKKAEEELTAAKKQAEDASSQKSDFLAKISHEIRTPLNAIIGFSEVMIEQRFGAIDNDRYRDYLRDIHTSGEHIMSLINDLLDLSKIEAGKLELTFDAVSAGGIIRECVALLQPQANSDRIIIRTSLPSSVPKVVADPRSLRQIVLNLLSNAIKFNNPGGQVIVSAALEDSGEVVIRVRDTGVGMSDKEIETALEPFRQLHTSRHGGGTGLGLPLTKALAEANRASFAISSTTGQGTLVEITFPTTRVLAE